MKIKSLRIISMVLLIILLLLLGTAVAGAIAKSNLAKQYPAPGQLVDMGGYKMHINCMGQGSPTVILEAGQSDYSVIWTSVQPEIAETTRVCSYDRAGYGWSEPSPYPFTAVAAVKELHTLLANANVEGPHVLVGHSLGGMFMRVYVHNYPDDVVGMVLVDSTHEERLVRYPELIKLNLDAAGQFRTLALLSSTGLLALAPQSIPNRVFPDDTLGQYRATLATTRYFETVLAEINAMEKRSAEVRDLQITTLENLPLTVLSAGHGDAIASFSEAENQQYW
jgi:pimeloyl-ACP methyl ester carboxylesterase